MEGVHRGTRGREGMRGSRAANLRAKIMDFRGFDSSRILV